MLLIQFCSLPQIVSSWLGKGCMWTFGVLEEGRNASREGSSFDLRPSGSLNLQPEPIDEPK